MQGSRKATATSPLISPNACYPFIKVAGSVVQGYGPRYDRVEQARFQRQVLLLPFSCLHHHREHRISSSLFTKAYCSCRSSIMVLPTNSGLFLFHMCYGLVFCADYLLQMFFKVRNNLFRIILPTDRHPMLRVQLCKQSINVHTQARGYPV